MGRSFIIDQVNSSSVDFAPQNVIYYLNTNGTKATDYRGILYDSGGPNGNFAADELYYFIIRAQYGTPVTLIKEAQYGDSSDTLRVYTADTESNLDSPITLNVDGTIATAGFTQIYSANGQSGDTIISIGSYQLGGYVITWYSNSTDERQGFKLSWEMVNNYTLTKQIPLSLCVPGPLSFRQNQQAYKVFTGK